jgi:hypothetical protein
MIYQIFTAIVGFASLASSTIYFQEDFNDAKWTDRWVVPSKWKSKVNYYKLFLPSEILKKVSLERARGMEMDSWRMVRRCN